MTGMNGDATEQDISRFRDATRGQLAVFAALIAAHLAAVVWAMPPRELLDSRPLLFRDHPVHTLRVQVYREAFAESWLPWGCNPNLSAGYFMGPAHDVGAKPQQVLGVLLPFLTEGTVIRLFLFATLLLMPLWTILAVRMLRLPFAAQLWVLVGFLGGAWLYVSFEEISRWGAVAFMFSTWVSPFVLVLFLRFLELPSWKRYFATLLALAGQSLLHVLGAVPIAPVLVVLTLITRPLAPKWRAAALAAPLGLVLLNGFWFVPFALEFVIPAFPREAASGMPRDLSYTSPEHLLAVLSVPKIAAAAIAIAFCGYGVFVMRQLAGGRAAAAFAGAGAAGLFLKFAGSFLPVVMFMQPSRFFVTAFAMLNVPIGLALYSVAKRLRIPQALGAGLGAVALTMLAALLAGSLSVAWRDVNEQGVEVVGEPAFIDLPRRFVPAQDEFDDLSRFVAERTTAEDRILMQSYWRYEQTALAAQWSRDVVGSYYPHTYDPTNFTRSEVWGRKIDKWTPEEFRESCRRWGITWVLTSTPEAAKLAAKAFGRAGEPAGPVLAFKTGDSTSRFLVGSGQVRASVNRLALDDVQSENGVVVLRYRYHPAWQAPEGVEVFQYRIPEDSIGFLGLRNPPPNLVLRFSPAAMFTAKWPKRE